MGEGRGDHIMRGTVIALMFQRDKGEAFCEAENLVLDTGKGIRGDCHYGSKKAQICILDEECRRWIGEVDREGLCLGRFRENILIGKAGPKDWKPGDCLRIGGAVLEIAQRGKKCFPECSRVQAGKECLLKKSCCFAVVQQGGKISTGDTVCFLEKK